MIPQEVLENINDLLSKKLLIFLIVLLSIILGYASVALFAKNNAIEKKIEEMIQVETGVKIDLSV